MDGWVRTGTHCHRFVVQLCRLTKTTTKSLDGLFDLCERVAVGFLALEEVGTIFLAGEISPEFSPLRESHLDPTVFLFVKLLRALGSVKERCGAATTPMKTACLLCSEGAI